MLKDIDKTSGDGRDVPDDSSEVVWVRWPSGRRKRQLRSKWKKFQYPTKTPDDYSGAIGSPRGRIRSDSASVRINSLETSGGSES